MKKIYTHLLAFLFFLVPLAYADLVVNMNSVDKSGENRGTVTAQDTKYGVLLKPNLEHLPPGLHGFHLHEKPGCGDQGMGAGGHLDPKKTNKHLGPYNDAGHLGDLPALYVDQTGKANTPVLAPRLKVSTLKNHALMIHEGGDNYTDTPPLGGGGARIACGVIK